MSKRILVCFALLLIISCLLYACVGNDKVNHENPSEDSGDNNLGTTNDTNVLLSQKVSSFDAFSIISNTEVELKRSITKSDLMNLTDCSSYNSLTLGEDVTNLPDNFFTEYFVNLDSITNNSSNLSVACPLNNRVEEETGLIFGWDNGKQYVDALLEKGSYSINAIGATKNSTKSQTFTAIDGWTFLSNGTSWFLNGAPKGNGTLNIPKTLQHEEYGIIRLTGIVGGASNSQKAIIGSEEDGYEYTSVIVPEGIKEIGNNSFYGCLNITSFKLPSTLEKVGAYAFCVSKTYSYATFDFAENTKIKQLGEGAFKYQQGLVTIPLSEGITDIPKDAFNSASLSEVLLPSTVTKIDDFAFWGCEMQSITIPKSVVSIGKNAFYGGTSLNELIIEGDILTIDSSAFAGREALSKLIINSGVSSLPNGLINAMPNLLVVENNSTSLKDVALPNVGDYDLTKTWKKDNNEISTLKAQGTYSASYSGKTTTGQYATKDYDGSEGLPFFETDAGYKYYSDGSNWYLGGVPVGSGTITIQSTLETERHGTITIYGISATEVPALANAFNIENLNYYNKLIINNGIVMIGDYACSMLSNLTSVSLPTSLLKIGDSAFSNTGITTISLPTSLKEIGHSAFAQSKLTSLTINFNIDRIGALAFSFTELSSVTIDGTVGTIGEMAFFSNPNLTTVNINRNITTIEHNAFGDCSLLANLNIGGSVTGIPDTIIILHLINVRKVVCSTYTNLGIILPEITDYVWKKNDEEFTSVTEYGTYQAVKKEE